MQKWLLTLMLTFMDGIKMDKIETMANDIAFLTNKDMHKLAQILVKEYYTRADALEAQLNSELFDQQISQQQAMV
jgi:hypothetical protein